jgi:hypothetical protein
MKDLAMLLYLLLLLPLLPFFFIYYFARRWYWLTIRGYWATREGRDTIKYEEKSVRSISSLTISGELMASGPYVVYVPTAEEWKRDMPAWARERRDEILTRMKKVLGTKNYEYDLSRAAEQFPIGKGSHP